MRAAQFLGANKPLEIIDVEEPEPGHGEVVVRVEAAGLCHSDVHILEGMLPMPTPLTMGHEVAGIVEAYGPGVSTASVPPVGSRVVVYGPNSCGDCDLCRTGLENLCEATPGRVGLGLHGGFAEKLVLLARNVVAVPDGVSAAVAAVAADAVLTPYHAIRSVGQVRPGEKVGVIGLGGLGLNAVAIAKLTGARVYGVDTNAEKAPAGMEAGCEQVFDQPFGLAAVTPDCIIDCVGIAATLSAASTLVRPGGRVVQVGLGTIAAEIPVVLLGIRQVSLHGVFWGTRHELVEVLDLVAAGRLVPAVSEITLDEVNDGYESLKDGTAHGRLAVVM